MLRLAALMAAELAPLSASWRATWSLRSRSSALALSMVATALFSVTRFWRCASNCAALPSVPCQAADKVSSCGRTAAGTGGTPAASMSPPWSSVCSSVAKRPRPVSSSAKAALLPRSASCADLAICCDNICISLDAVTCSVALVDSRCWKTTRPAVATAQIPNRMPKLRRPFEAVPDLGGGLDSAVGALGPLRAGAVSMIVVLSLSAAFAAAVVLPKGFNAMLRAPPCSWDGREAGVRPGSFEAGVEELNAGQQFCGVDLQPKVTLRVAQAFCDPGTGLVARVGFEVIHAAQPDRVGDQ